MGRSHAVLLQPCGTVPKGTAPVYRLIIVARFPNRLYLDWGVTYTTAAQLSRTLNRCYFHFSIDISDAYNLSVGWWLRVRAAADQAAEYCVPRVWQPSEVMWIYAMVNGCVPSTCRGVWTRT